MTRSFGREENILIAAATISSELRGVRKIAREMSLGVMNAKAISHRAGDMARGFRPITDFIAEMAQKIILGVNQISKKSVEFSYLAVRYRHLSQSIEHYQKIIDRGDAVRYISSLQQVIKKLGEESGQCRKNFIFLTKTLSSLLGDIQRSTRGAQIISATSRVEASRAESFSQSLEVIANQVDNSTDDIRRRLQISHDHLTGVLNLLYREE
ncbi:hypothetical protein MNBD_GAMMA24-1886 [hydrothermal vent metagenome]|uniref:Methyl-accepting transducer domain-containing protein n=1 Tax=hydrothermal vent metagenome TaxID=652676 RepID=A0A3B1BEZ7_9ZZZZ